MSVGTFIKFLIGAVLLSIAIFFLINLFIPLSSYFDFLLMSIGFFSVLAFIAFVVGDRSIRNRGGAGFIGLVIANVFLKLVGSFVFVALYAKYTTPADRFFLIPFLVTYLIFTSLETYFMSQQARESK